MFGIKKHSLNKPIRNSNIELLRILCAFFVVMWHEGVHEPYFSQTFYFNTYVFHCLQPYLIVPVSIFAFISGYFMIEKLNWKVFLRFFLQTFIYYGLMLGICAIVFSNIDIYADHRHIQWTDYLSGGRDWWYVQIILVVYLTAPLIAYLFMKINKYILFSFIVVIYVLACLPINYPLHENVWLWLYAMYMLGGWIYKFTPNLVTNQRVFWISIGFVLLVQIINVVTYAVYQDGEWGYPSNHVRFLMPFLVVAIFTIFVQLPIKNSKTINYFAQLTLPIYMFHFIIEYLVNYGFLKVFLEPEIGLIIKTIIVFIFSSFLSIILFYINKLIIIFLHIIFILLKKIDSILMNKIEIYNKIRLYFLNRN